MTRFEIATLSCKILALWLFAQGTYFFAAIVMMAITIVGGLFGADGIDWYRVKESAVAGALSLVTIAVAAIFWLGAPHIARRMVSDDPSPLTGEGITKDDALAIAFTAVGVYLLIPALQQVASIFIEMSQNGRSLSFWWSDHHWQLRFWPTLVGIALSLCLILGPRGIVRVVLWARAAVARNDPPKRGVELVQQDAAESE